MTREEILIAYVDGELDAAERARFEAELAEDPALAGAVARHRQLAERVSAAYAPVLEEPVPPQLLAVAAAANDRGGRARLAPWAAVAASLVMGVLAGRALWPQSGPVAMADGGLEARGQLARALTANLAADAGPVKVSLSLKTADGRYCRTFESAADRLAGLACRDGGRWRLRTLTAWSPPPATAYRQAGSATPPEVLAAVDALAAEPLDAAAERAARAKGWR
jgi:hypothetical protein